MIFYPAIDIQSKKCVRLRQGKVDSSTIFNSSPLIQAQQFISQGSEWLHVVDLDAAISRSNINQTVIEELVFKTDIPIQLGGGIREIETIEFWLNLGVARIILGTVALENPDLVRLACDKFPNRIAVGIDSNESKVVVEGWQKESQITTSELARAFEDVGVVAIIYTDVQKDGMMLGPDFSGTAELANSVTIPIIASGGISSIDDLQKIKTSCPSLNGVICGRSIYEQKFSIKEAKDVLNCDAEN